MESILVIFMRVLHILSAVTLTGGALAWRFAVSPALSPLSPETRDKVDNAVAAAWKPFVWTASIGILLSGFYNFFRKVATGVPKEYHMVFGIKFLLALHVIAVGILLGRAANKKREKQLTGVVFSAVTIVVLSAVLRYLSTK